MRKNIHEAQNGKTIIQIKQNFYFFIQKYAKKGKIKHLKREIQLLEVSLLDISNSVSSRK